MRTTNAIEMAATPAAIYALAHDTAAWPRILPHYRYVRVLERAGATLVVEMAARRGRIPVRWIARQENLPEIPEIRFTHVRGWTRGMDVVWRFEPLGPNRTRVVIEHELRFRFPIFAEWLGEHVVGDFFVHAVANRTLARMKARAEGTA